MSNNCHQVTWNGSRYQTRLTTKKQPLRPTDKPIPFELQGLYFSFIVYFDAFPMLQFRCGSPLTIAFPRWAIRRNEKLHQTISVKFYDPLHYLYCNSKKERSLLRKWMLQDSIQIMRTWIIRINQKLPLRFHFKKKKASLQKVSNPDDIESLILSINILTTQTCRIKF